MKKQTGFTLIELLVVMAIMGIIASISIVNYEKMGRHIELENAAFNVALTIKEAQIYGISKRAREIGVPIFGESYGYGIFMDKSGAISGTSNTEFILYVDRGVTLDGKFTDLPGLNCTGGTDDECYSQIFLTKGNHITGIYFHNGTNWISPSVDIVDISFVRPNPDAIIIDSFGAPQSRVRIVLQDRGLEIKACVDIGIVGSITVKGGADCDT